MSITQFTMVEELASLIKDNFPSKHLVLVVEEALVNYLQDDPRPDGILELEPMSSYDRLILHRLADIFGFAHESAGEGDDRHLVLQRCPETSIPSILVSDIVWQHDACQSPSTAYQLLRRDETSTVLKMDISSSSNFLKREAAYLAARERIFGIEESEFKETARQKPRHDPAVARRMISHALGQKITQNTQVKGDESGCSDDVKAQDEKLSQRDSSDTRASKDAVGVSKTRTREQNLGAAKRMFANAMGIPASKDAVPKFRGVKTTTSTE